MGCQYARKVFRLAIKELFLSLSIFERFAVTLGLVLWVLVIPYQRLGPSVEGYLFPVVEPVVLREYKPFPPPEYRHKWTAAAQKNRECSFQRIDWFMGRRDGLHVPVPASFTDPPQLRFAGVLEWEGLAISLDPLAVENNSFAYVYHACGVGIFRREVRTLFYDSALNM